jgi:predicted nucleic acid-binding protein
VPDASVAAKWFLDDEPEIEAAREIRAQQNRGDIDFAAPECFYYEFGNIIRTAERRTPPRISLQRADEIIREILALPISVSRTTLLLPQAFARSRANDVSLYDALYLATAEMLDATFITADGPLVERVRDLPFVRRLGQP